MTAPNVPVPENALLRIVRCQLTRAGSALRVIVAGACVLVAPHMASAQGTSGIAGVVHDTSGAVLPGVTVEASSPALIEKVRTVVSDSEGQYKILDLPGGTYTVTFTLTGFSTIKREGLLLTANFTANVTADMKVGALEETITVSGQAPVVDVQNTAQHKVVSGELLFALPITKEMGGFATVTVGALVSPVGQDVGGNIDPMNGYTMIHGSHITDSRALLDGMQFNGEGAGRGFYFNPAAASEVSVQLGGQTAEYENGGVQANLVPKDGGNRFTGLVSGNRSNHGADNLTDALRARGLTSTSKTNRTYDLNAGLGGPIKKDRLWFYTAHRIYGFSNQIANNYANLTQNTPFYAADLSRPGLNEQSNRSNGVRFTYQLAAKDKISVSWDNQHTDLCLACQPLAAPEASVANKYADPNYLIQAKWTHLASNKLLFEAANSSLIFHHYWWRRPNVVGRSILNANTGFRYNAPLASAVGDHGATESNQRASMSYVTGSHAFKVGFTTQEAWHFFGQQDSSSCTTASGPCPDQGATPNPGIGVVDYTFLNGRPSSLTQWAEPLIYKERLKMNLGLYVQDQWTLKKLTLNLGVRYDYFNAYVPAQSLGAGPFVPARSYDEVDCVPCWKDINPRLAASYDLFGNGKTALKVNVGRFVAADIYSKVTANNPIRRSVVSATRTWNDANGNYAPDCDLANLGAQDLAAVGGDICGAISNRFFGLGNPNATIYAPDTLLGYGARSYNWQYSASLQQQLRSNVALNVGYFRTTWGAFSATQNTAVTAQDFTSYCVTAPTDSRLPGGGGYPICGLYDVSPAKFGVTQTLVSRGPTENGNQTEIYNGFDVVLNVRLQKGINLNGGVNTGRTTTNDCGLVLNNPQFSSLGPSGAPFLSGGPTYIPVPYSQAYCDVVPPWKASTQGKLSGVVPLPYEFAVAVTYQNLPGIPWYASNVFTNAQIAPALGRPLAAGPNGTVTVPLITPESNYEARIQQLDLRFSKSFRISGQRLEPQFDVYNALNASPILSVNNSYGPNWRIPTQILAGRLLKFGMQMTF